MSGASERSGVVIRGFLLFLLCSAPGLTVEPSDQHRADPKHLQEASIAGYRHLTFVTGTADPEDRLPTIVGLHWSGATPETIIAGFQGIDFPARIVLPQGKYRRRAGYSWFPSNYVDLEVASQKKVTFEVMDELSSFIDSVRTEYPIRGKPVIVGISYGGDLSFLLAIHHPEQVLAAFPVASRFLPAWMPATNTCKPKCPLVYAMHGDEDTTVPMAPTRRVAKQLAGMDFHVEFHEYAGVAHDFSAQMKDDFAEMAERVLVEDQAASRAGEDSNL